MSEYNPVKIGITLLNHRHNIEGAEGAENCAACEIARLRARLEKAEVVVRAVEEWAKTTRVKLDHARGNRQEINLEKALIAYREQA